MRRYLLLAAAILSAGCSQPRRPATPDEKPPHKYFTADPATVGGLRGNVRFEGKIPPLRRISMDAEEACKTLHASPVFDDQVLTGKDGELANVFVYIKSGLEGKEFAPPKEAVILDQRGCQYLPRIIALHTGQTLTVRNSDPVSHNIHPMPHNNRDWNQQQPPQALDLQRRFAHPEVMIPVKCNVHAWMKSYIGVLDHPFFAVTNRDGSFVFEGVPPGEYTLAAWHEVFGETTQSLTVRKSETAKATFLFR